MELPIKRTTLAFALAAVMSTPAFAGGDAHRSATVGSEPSTSTSTETSRSIDADVSTRPSNRAGMTTGDRTGMTGADAGSTTLRGDVRNRASSDIATDDAVPLMRDRNAQGWGDVTVHPNSPFDSEVTTMGQRPL